MRVLFTLLCVFFSQLSIKAQTLRTLKPSTTDPTITTFDNAHLTVLPVGTPKNDLFVFLPGTGAPPAGYTFILKTAANLGYHAIGLMYQNEEAVNLACAGTSDSTCFGRVRQESFDGSDKSDKITIPRENSIESRLQKALLYLKTNAPTENWGQFLSAKDSILWDKIVISGHSQGGGHAGYISKIKKVNRLVMFCANDWWFSKSQPAAWITQTGATPPQNLFVFQHEKDQLINYTFAKVSWTAYGMTSFGAPVLVDNSTAPYKNSHELFTQLIPNRDSTNFHNAPVVDINTPLDANNKPILEPVWQYMLSASVNTPVNELKQSSEIKAYPNPFSTSVTIENISVNGNQAQSFALFNMQGAEIVSGNFYNSTELPTSNLPDGIYFLRVNSHFETKTFKLVHLN